MRFLLPALFSVALLSACTFVEKKNGARVTTADITSIKAGESTKLDVYNTLGAPSTVSRLGDETWYYVYTEADSAFFSSPTNNTQDTIAISFNSEEKVTKVDNYDIDSANSVGVDDDKTKTSGRDITFIDQMLGNFGTFGTQYDR